VEFSMLIVVLFLFPTWHTSFLYMTQNIPTMNKKCQFI
jgi:hypothetical protein